MLCYTHTCVYTYIYIYTDIYIYIYIYVERDTHICYSNTTNSNNHVNTTNNDDNHDDTIDELPGDASDHVRDEPAYLYVYIYI